MADDWEKILKRKNHKRLKRDKNVPRLWMKSNLTSFLLNRQEVKLDSGAERPGFKSQSRRCRITVLGKLFTPIVPLFTKQQNW